MGIEEMLPKLAEGGISVFCIGIFAYFIYLLFNKLMNHIETALEDNKEQTNKFASLTEEFINVVNEQDLRIEAKLDRISEKIDDLKDR